MIEKYIQQYQCCGCINGCDLKCGRFENSESGIGCENHYPGTFITPIVGNIFLGLPKGFNRIGFSVIKELFTLEIFKNYEMLKQQWKYDKFNIPVWKYKNENSHVLIRGLCPRINKPFLHIILENCIDKIDCYEITENDLKEMD